MKALEPLSRNEVSDAFLASFLETGETCVVHLPRLAHPDGRQIIGRGSDTQLDVGLRVLGKHYCSDRGRESEPARAEINLSERHAGQSKASVGVGGGADLGVYDADIGKRDDGARRVTNDSPDGATTGLRGRVYGDKADERNSRGCGEQHLPERCCNASAHSFSAGLHG